ncbi:MAG: hypothetical protein JSW53_02500 [Candidatus Bathyarchaeota archaeon]|nr:MAG: hypothetical protein JSW53_02500 [Candidatus Bathyarchaeota archaeon]
MGEKVESIRVEILVLTSVIIAIVLVFILPAWFFSGTPPVEIAKFTGGNPASSDVAVTNVFQVTKEVWMINLVSRTTSLGWSLRVELYREGESDNPIRSLLGKWDLLEERVIWELSPETTEGTFPSPTDYLPDLPPDRYYLRIHWTRMVWCIHIFEEPQVIYPSAAFAAARMHRVSLTGKM